MMSPMSLPGCKLSYFPHGVPCKGPVLPELFFNDGNNEKEKRPISPPTENLSHIPEIDIWHGEDDGSGISLAPSLRRLADI